MLLFFGATCSAPRLETGMEDGGRRQERESVAERQPSDLAFVGEVRSHGGQAEMQLRAKALGTVCRP